MRSLFYRIIFAAFLILTQYGCKAQERSSNIQVIDGKKFYIHKIEKKQSLYSISKTYNVTLDELYQYNPDLRSGARAGQEIRIPFQSQAVATPSLSIDTNKYQTYKIQKGETMYSLIKKFNLTEKQLLTYNPSLSEGVKEGALIIVGEKPKKKPGKENKDVKPPPPPVTSTITTVDSALFRPVAKAKKESYNIALVLPFNLEQSLSLDLNQMARSNNPFPAVQALAVDFYLGFKSALDSLRGKGFELNLQLYDIDEKDSLKLGQVEQKMNETDMVFGPLYTTGFRTISKKAAELHVPVISPVTRQNKILFNNIYISKTNPSQYTLMESLADYCIDSLMNNNANLILMSVFDKDKKENVYVSAFRQYFNERQAKLGHPLKDTVKVAKGIAGLKTAYMPNVKNIVVSLSNNQVFIADFTTQLAMFADKKDIVLCGWETLTGMDNIDQEYLNQLHYTFPHQFNIVNTGAYKTVADAYTNLQGTTPSEYFYIGFDIAYYYLKNLKEQGPEFIYRLDELPMETNYMRFKYFRPDNITGFDNRGIFIFRYNDYQLSRTGWK
jgi:LysM repeat protein